MLYLGAMPADSPRVLITGANGFVGSRLARTFAQNGYQVVAGVRKTADLSLLGGIPCEYRYGDITHPDTLPDMIRDCTHIIHNAGLVKAPSPDRFFAVNETGTRNLCEAITRHAPEVRKLVLISSLAAAGPSREGRAVGETDPPNPITTYGKSKLAGEHAALSFAGKIPLTILRPSGVYGPGDKEIFTFFQAVHRHIRPLVGDTSRRMQLVHVDDLCRAVYLATFGDAACGGIYFVAESRAYTLGELVAILSEVSGTWTIPLRVPGPLFRAIAFASESVMRLVGATPMLSHEKAGELLASWEVSTAKATADFGFTASIPFADGARDTFAWYRKEGWL